MEDQGKGLWKSWPTSDKCLEHASKYADRNVDGISWLELEQPGSSCRGVETLGSDQAVKSQSDIAAS